MPKDRKNKYTCQECKRYVVTIDVDEGVTPFMMGCPFIDCVGMMHSSFYNVDVDDEPSFEWYKPDEAEIAKLESNTRDHVERGGLLRRKKKGAEPDDQAKVGAPA